MKQSWIMSDGHFDTLGNSIDKMSLVQSSQIMERYYNLFCMADCPQHVLCSWPVYACFSTHCGIHCWQKSCWDINNFLNASHIDTGGKSGHIEQDPTSKHIHSGLSIDIVFEKLLTNFVHLLQIFELFSWRNQNFPITPWRQLW